MSNGVRQGSVLSPSLFAVYLDGLLVELISFVLVVIGEAVLLVLLVMQMMWYYWLHGTLSRILNTTIVFYG